MSDIDNMTPEELETALQNDVANLGQNQDIDTTVDETEQHNDEVTDTGGTETDETETDEVDDDTGTETKSEKKIKKLLSQRNKERSAKAELEERVKQLENLNADTDFYNSNPDAVKLKDNITAKMAENNTLSRQDAYLLLAGENMLADRTWTPWARKMTGSTPWNITTPKKVSDMTSAELDAKVNELYNSWGITI